jgi:hypothetical protein
VAGAGLRVGSVVLVALMSFVVSVPRADAHVRHSPKHSKYVDLEDLGSTASGLAITRVWRIPKSDPRRLLGSIVLRNGTSSPVTEYFTEGIPTASLETIRFSPASIVVQTSNGLARMTVTVPPNGSTTVRYNARLVKQRKETAKQRLPEVRAEMINAVVNAQATPDDIANASWNTRYFGKIQLDSITASPGVTYDASGVGVPHDASISLTPEAGGCTVPSRGCAFSATESFFGTPPKLARLVPSGTNLTADGTADVNTREETAFNCRGTPVPTHKVRAWAIEPTQAKLSPSGWRVTELHYRVVEDTSADGILLADYQCFAANSHREFSGVLTG